MFMIMTMVDYSYGYIHSYRMGAVVKIALVLTHPSGCQYAEVRHQFACPDAVFGTMLYYNMI